MMGRSNRGRGSPHCLLLSEGSETQNGWINLENEAKSWTTINLNNVDQMLTRNLSFLTQETFAIIKNAFDNNAWDISCDDFDNGSFDAILALEKLPMR